MPVPERQLIRRIAKAAPQRGRALVRGIGDDCAVLRPPAGHDLLVTTDFTLEGIHFRREWHPADAVGHRCLARGLSDVAAMGGEPLAIFLSLALPAKLPQRWADDFLKGMLRLANSFDVPLAGGDIAESPAGVLADIMLLASTPKGTAVLRSGARPGDRIYVTGTLGGSAATLALLQEGRKLRAPGYSRHFYPAPRIETGSVLRKNKSATAMIDLSDGLSVDLAHICEESGVGAELSAAEVPRAILRRHEVDLRFALHGGEDYELLFTARPAQRIPAKIAGVPVTMIGEITRAKAIFLNENGRRRELRPKGWQHFQRS